MTHQAAVKKKDTRAGHAAAYAAHARRSVDAELARVAGIERVKSRDPVHHLIEHSRNMFDLLGRVNAEKMADPERAEFDAVNKELNDSAAKRKGERTDESGVNEEGAKGGPEKGETGAGTGSGELYRRFAEIAFSKGRLLCAVEQGGGKTMMASCIRRSIDQSPPSDSRQTEVRESGSTKKRVPDALASISYHQFTRGALSLVVDTAQNLTTTLEVFERMASGEFYDRLGLTEIDTVSRMYPFLNMAPDKEKLASYREQLRGLPDGNKKKALEYGVNRLNTIIAHKERMRINFFFELRKILDNSKRAAELFSQPATEEEIFAELLTEVDGDDDDGGNGGSET